MSKYQVVPNRCGCHPETCCCNDYAVVDEKGNKYTTCFREAEAEDIARLLNTKTDLAVQPDYKALYQAEQKLRMEAEACADMLRGSQQDADKVNAQPVAWESTTPTYIRYITEAKYQRLTQSARAWYRPYRCSSCAQPDPAMDDVDPTISNPTRQEWDAAKSDPAMAGDEWLNALRELVLSYKDSIFNPSGDFLDKRRAAYVAIIDHARKRVQPASGEDAKRIAWLSENDCMIERLVSTKGTRYRLSWGETWQSDWYDTPGQAIGAAMRQGGQS